MSLKKIQCVCGFLKKNGLEAETFTGDVGTCLSNPCDVIFISKDLAERISDRAQVPIMIVENFMDSAEVESQVKAYFASLKA